MCMFFDSSCQADATTSSSIVAGFVYLCGMEAGCSSCPRSAQRSMHARIASEQNTIAETVVNRWASTQTSHGWSVRPFSCS